MWIDGYVLKLGHLKYPAKITSFFAWNVFSSLPINIGHELHHFETHIMGSWNVAPGKRWRVALSNNHLNSRPYCSALFLAYVKHPMWGKNWRENQIVPSSAWQVIWIWRSLNKFEFKRTHPGHPISNLQIQTLSKYWRFGMKDLCP